MISVVRAIPLLALMIGFQSQAQKTDSSYIASYNQKFRVISYVSTNYLQVDDGVRNYTPNYPLTTGIGLAIKNTIISLDAGYSFFPLKNKNVYGRSKITDFQIHRYGRSSIVDFYYQNYQGFYTQKKEGQVDEVLPDMGVLQIGAEYSHILTGKQFSSKAAFDLNEIQKRSSGSWLVGGGAYFSRIKGLHHDISDHVNNLENFQLGFNAGYGYSWVLNDRWMLTAMAKAGVNFGNIPREVSKLKIEIFPTAYARFSGNYHKDDWGLSLSFFIGNKSISPLNDRSINLTSVNMQLSYVKHIDHLFKKKRD
ncbi:DUF4421 domain-containing protein [Chryseobacterium sp. LC2016-27]|uniref:DUF4421 family protein n=1 Tax=Chryseobacterium sp. LC2016-27 TaxID=2897326 RepID=UPI001E37D834|nr:DUF4421 family protein [Chryseobacterium sp. LC2016-27]MCD0456400.1 DUF4421 domain-containing protein [Chryseobacterium sp. LC2016-27]